MRITPPPKNDRTIVATARGEGPTGGEVVTYDPPGEGGGMTAGERTRTRRLLCLRRRRLPGPADGPRPCFAEHERRLIDVDASIRHAYGIMGRGRGTRRSPPRWTGSSRTRWGSRRGRRTTTAGTGGAASLSAGDTQVDARGPAEAEPGALRRQDMRRGPRGTAQPGVGATRGIARAFHGIDDRARPLGPARERRWRRGRPR
jgi:hypothetical protein